jgi:uncharacterized protein (DUF488 family)
VDAVVDVRTAPGSRRHPHVGREQMEGWLPAAGIAYRWETRLGGWRKAGPGSPNGGLRNASFRGYADWMATAEFEAALDLLVEEAGQRLTATMCSEAVWWRCHRRLLADAAVLLRGAEVLHLGHDGSLTSHPVTAQAVRMEAGSRAVVRYPLAAGSPDGR